MRTTIQPALQLVFILDKTIDRLLVEKLDVSLSQFKILMALKHSPNASQRTIAKFWDMTEASVSRQANILLSKKLIQKVKNPTSKREYILRKTRAGKAQIRRAINLIDSKLENLFQNIGREERTRLAVSLNHMLSVIRKEANIQSNGKN